MFFPNNNNSKRLSEAERDQQDELLEQLYAFLNSTRDLPKPLEHVVCETINEIEKEEGVEYITSYEKYSMLKGEIKMLKKVLIAKFGPLPPEQEVLIDKLRTPYLNFVLSLIAKHLWGADSVDEMFHNISDASDIF